MLHLRPHSSWPPVSLLRFADMRRKKKSDLCFHQLKRGKRWEQDEGGVRTDMIEMFVLINHWCHGRQRKGIQKLTFWLTVKWKHKDLEIHLKPFKGEVNMLSIINNQKIKVFLHESANFNLLCKYHLILSLSVYLTAFTTQVNTSLNYLQHNKWLYKWIVQSYFGLDIPVLYLNSF